MIKLAIFDWDGTLANSLEKIIECKQFLSKKYHLPLPSRDTIKSVIGIEFNKAMKRCFPDANPKQLSQLCEEFHDLMKTAHYQAALFPNVKVVLNKLIAKNIHLAIASAKDEKELMSALTHHGIVDKFAKIYAGNMKYSKPDKAIIIELMEYFKCKNNEVIMIGDTITDITFARNANIKVVAVSSGADSEATLSLANPDMLIENVSQLENIIDNL